MRNMQCFWTPLFFKNTLIRYNTYQIWIGFSPVANFAAQFYRNDGAADLMSVVFLAVDIPFGFVAMWSMGKYGIRVGVSWFEKFIIHFNLQNIV